MNQVISDGIDFLGVLLILAVCVAAMAVTL